MSNVFFENYVSKTYFSNYVFSEDMFRKLSTRIEELDKTLKHVVVCHHGIRSRMVAKHLVSIGFEKVINLSSGVEGWASEVDSTMSKYA